jgi:low affinity Fe/Cu permease
MALLTQQAERPTAGAPVAKDGRGPFTRAFANAARKAGRLVGHPVSFLTAFVLVLAWAVSGPVFGFSEGWQLVINTGTTILTFLMVFLLQHSQNRDTEAVQLKLDELIRAVDGARNSMMAVERLDEADLTRLQQAFD